MISNSKECIPNISSFSSNIVYSKKNFFLFGPGLNAAFNCYLFSLPFSGAVSDIPLSFMTLTFLKCTE